jgi:hypothetical protein
VSDLSNNKNRGSIRICLLIILGIILGTGSGLTWYYGYVQFVRAMVPYALAVAVVMLVSTAALRARYGNPGTEVDENLQNTSGISIRRYSPLILITAVVFIAFSLVVLGTYLPLIYRIILSYVGSISFWTMLFSFAAMIMNILYRRIR